MIGAGTLAAAGESAGYEVAEDGTCPGAYSWAVAGSLEGVHRYRVLDSTDTVVAAGLVYLTNDDEVRDLDDIPASVDLSSLDDDFAAIESHLDEIDAQLVLIKAKTDRIGTAEGNVVNNAGASAGGDITMRKAATWTVTLEVGEDLTDADEVYWTFKRNKGKTDE